MYIINKICWYGGSNIYVLKWNLNNEKLHMVCVEREGCKLEYVVQMDLY